MNEEYMNLLNSAKDNDYLSFKNTFDKVMVDKLDGYYEDRTKELYNVNEDENDNKPITIKFQTGMKGTWKEKTFKNSVAMEKWLDKNGDNIENVSYTYDKK
jgi:hypothetical protein